MASAAIGSLTVPPVPEYTSSSPFRLPNELWREIFELATYVHRELGVAACKTNEDPLSLAIEIMTADDWRTDSLLREQIPNRLSFSLVSKQWRQLMLPILYRSLVVRYPYQIRPISQLLEDNPHIVRFVRRLQLQDAVREEVDQDYIDAIYEESNSTYPLTKLPEIVANCVKLVVIWTDDPTGRITRDLLSGEADRLSQHALQQLRVRDDWDFALHTLKAAALFKHLRVLDLQFIPPNLPLLHDEDSTGISLPLLEILVISLVDWRDDVDAFLCSSSVPKLHSISFYIPNQSLATSNFLKKFGAQIRTLYLKDVPTKYCELFVESISYMPNIEQLVVDRIMPTGFLETISHHSNIRRLYVLPKPSLFSNFNPFNVDILSVFPKLEVFEIADLLTNETNELLGVIDMLLSVLWYLKRNDESIRSKGITLNVRSSDGLELSMAQLEVLIQKIKESESPFVSSATETSESESESGSDEDGDGDKDGHEDGDEDED